MTLPARSDLPYLSAFGAPSSEAWRGAVEKVLRGADFEKRLVGRSADGIRIEPLYPAAAPAARALRAEAGRWHVAARLDHPQPREAQALALADLEGGADTLTISFAGAPAARGHGLVAADVAALDAALDGVMLDLIRLRLDPAPQGRIDALLLAALIEKRGHAPAELSVAFGLDPIGVFAGGGSLAVPSPEIGRKLAQTIRALKERGFSGPFVTIDSRPYHEAGASEAQELGAALATAVAYLRALEAQGMTLAEARDALAFTLVADTDEFLTVAKFRAARLLWNRIQQACGLTPAPARIHAETAWRSLTRRDPHVNLLRGTIAAFSAGIGGTDSLTVQPFTAALGLPDAFARRVARNTQLILLEESNLWRVADPAAGAGGFEALTQALCEQGWQAFQRSNGSAAAISAAFSPRSPAATSRRRWPNNGPAAPGGGKPPRTDHRHQRVPQSPRGCRRRAGDRAGRARRATPRRQPCRAEPERAHPLLRRWRRPGRCRDRAGRGSSRRRPALFQAVGAVRGAARQGRRPAAAPGRLPGDARFHRRFHRPRRLRPQPVRGRRPRCAQRRRLRRGRRDRSRCPHRRLPRLGREARLPVRFGCGLCRRGRSRSRSARQGRRDGLARRAPGRDRGTEQGRRRLVHLHGLRRDRDPRARPAIACA
ncbi:hypothetical protein BOSEA1005_12652 [Hyphomicrobiales bacterium]|nr:hypothetical protein BOSEA1005_12652 [Hyphomicrobiales bacterium]